MDTGYINLFRKFEDWEWYDDPSTKAVFIHCLIKANYKEKSWRGVLIKPGELFTSVKQLSLKLGLSEKQVRTSLKKLEKTGEIKTQGASKGTMITVCNFESYQVMSKSKGEQSDEQRANEGRTKGEQRATTNKEKKDKKEKKEIREGGDFQKIVDLWNTTCSPPLPKVEKITAERKNKIKTRFTEMGGRDPAMDTLKQIFVKVKKSDFLKGGNPRGWEATFDWIFENGKNWVKIIEGNYDNKESGFDPKNPNSQQKKWEAF
jgi:DNA-binding transcriptional regulator YhcF (GntR family)